MEINYQSMPVDVAGGDLTARGFGFRGFNEASREVAKRHALRVSETARLWAAFKAGEVDTHLMREAFQPTREYAFKELRKIAPHVFQEAMTRSDFSNLTTYVLDRMMLGNYAKYPFTYPQLCRVNKAIQDFRTVERWIKDGGERTWQVVGELEGFNRHELSTDKYTYAVAKYEGGQQISWESVINDDMSTFNDLPSRLANGGGRTIELFATKLYADANGPHASFYTSGNGNIIDTSNYAGGSVNPPLTYNNLAGALAAFMNLTNSDGVPINPSVDNIRLVVGDGMLYQTALNIKNTQFIASTVAGGTKASGSVMYDTQVNIKNWLAGNFEIVFNPELRKVVTASNGAVAARSWWLVCTPSTGRPAFELGFLKGFATPQLYRKASNTIPISGGGPLEMMGDYETMSTEIKGLVVFGGTRMDPKMTMASNGSGS